MIGEDDGLLTFCAGYSPLLSFFTSPQAPRHFEIERKRISLLSLFFLVSSLSIKSLKSNTALKTHLYVVFLFLSATYTLADTHSIHPKAWKLIKICSEEE